LDKLIKDIRSWKQSILNTISNIIGYIILSLLIVTSLTCNNSETPENAQPYIQIAVSAPELDFGRVDVGHTLEQSIVITNSFGFTRQLADTVSINGTAFSIVRGGGSYSISPGESKTVVVRFSPSSGKPDSGALTIKHNALNARSPISIPLRGNSQSSISTDISVDPTSLTFDTIAIGKSSTKTVTVTNPAGSTQTLSGIITINGSGFSIISGNGSYSLSAGQSRLVTVSFSANSSGSYSGSVQISHNSTNTPSPITVPLIGYVRSTASVDIEVSPTFLDFGTVTTGQSLDRTITIRNTSTTTGILTGSINSSGSGFFITSGGGSYSLTAGQSRLITVSFSANSNGSYSGSVQISHNATNTSSPVTVPLSGSVQSIALVGIDVSPTFLDFGTVTTGQSLDRTITVRNTSTTTGILSGNINSSGSGFSIISGSGSYSLTAGQYRLVTVRLSTKSNGSYSGSVQISHNATNTTSPITVPLSGIGQNLTTMSILVTPQSLDFGSVTVGQSSEQSFTITNSSNSVNILTGSVDFLIVGAGFSIVKSSGPYRLSPGQSKTITVRFKPVMKNLHGGTIGVWHNASNEYNPIHVSIRGLGQ
jgi:hypothetical protein